MNYIFWSNLIIMKFKFFFVYFLICLFLFGITGCGASTIDDSNNTTTNISQEGYPAYPSPQENLRLNLTSTRVVEVVSPQDNLSTLTGVIFSERTNKPIVEISVQLAEVYYEGDQGAYVLDTAQSPYTTTDKNGRFVFANIEARDYVLVIGNVEVNDYQIISNEQEGNLVWSARANEILDTGTHVVLLDSWE
jgi:hypothetical protein